MTQPHTRPTLPELFRRGAGVSLGVVAVLAVVGALYLTQGVLVQVFVALFLAVSLDPLVRWLVLRKIGRPWAVTITLTILVLMVAAFVIFVVTPLVREATALGSDFPGYLHDARVRLGLPEKVETYLLSLPDLLADDAAGFASQFLGAVLSVLLVVVLTIYFLLDLPRIRLGFVRLFPERNRLSVQRGVTVVVDKVGAYMIGNVVISLIAGAVTFAALLALGVPFALPLAVIVAIADMIPLVGATIGAAVCVLVAAATSDGWLTTVLTLAFFILYQQIENYVIAPRIMRNAVDVPAVAVLLAGLVGASVLGLMGALMAIPLVAAAKALINKARSEPNDVQIVQPRTDPQPASRLDAETTG
ncbi:putative PurR-regulated permease PerM [Allocatelliglobosispora scoriae]|uniref:Putative PurR-regulated permease PerM n=1 Tax=Allocatelliglobosispora scoriae TaxID=643052 RepID=A0A841BKZ5_9ACTN|nr:AI-2E family transporter [Allocatelliglobosispora scoriae]MBB5867663.1 putative PurR-regulated permease PerM [Allocatelliglobosispora scoriae]